MNDFVDLGRTDRVEAMADRLYHHLSDSSATSSFAIVGPWGSGKTWLLESMLDNLSKNGRPLSAGTLIRFNPWFFADESALFVGFAELLLELTPKKNNSRKALAGLLSVVGPSLKFGSVDLTRLADRIKDRALGVSGPEQIRNQVSSSVRDSGRHVLVIMDDLDRLNPSELLMLFKLIRLVGDVPGISFLLTYDEGTLLQLLSRTDIAAGSEERARRYLEKIVEVKWIVPPLTQHQLEELVDTPIAAIVAEGTALANDPRQPETAFDYRIGALIRKRITTPRAAERFVAMFREIPPSALAELHFDDLAFALYLRAYVPKVWSIVVEESEVLTGGGMYGFLREDKSNAQLVRLGQRIRDAVDKDGGDAEEVLDLIQEHFPRFSNAIKGRSDQQRSSALRISNAEFIARYMWFDLPPGAVSEVTVKEKMGELPEAEAATWLTAEILREPTLVLESMSRSADANHSLAARMLAFLETLYATHGIDRRVDPFLDLDARIRVHARPLLAMMGHDELDGALNVSLREARLLRRIITGDLRRNSYPDHVHAKLLAAADRLAGELVRCLESSPSPALGDNETREALLDLLRIDAKRASTFAMQMMDDLRWRADDVASLYVTESVGSESRRVGFNLTALRRHWGDDFASYLARAKTLGYPRDWELRGVPHERVDAIDETIARGLASFGLIHDKDLNVADFD